MGAQIGCEYVLGGHAVRFVARDTAAAAARVRDGLELAAKLGLVAPGAEDELQGRITVTVEPDPDPDCDLVVESLPENHALKVSLLKPIAGQARDAAIATNTSSLSITMIGEEIGAPERTVGTHYWNPPLLMPLVEVIAGARTSRRVVDFVSNTLIALGKRPVLVERDVPGFVWNRLQLAVMREAVWLAEQGVASPSTIDTIVREGLARRWRHIGPFEAAALGGIDTWREVGANLLPELSRAQDLDGLDRWLQSDEARLRDSRARRDAALATELARDRDAHIGP
jgi:3-hydroxybutyryl-CoA dehydrogenase